MSNDIVLIGNGIISLQIAREISIKDPSIKISIIGDPLRLGSATLAAAAMFNSFAEIEHYTLDNDILKQRFEFNKESNAMWPSIINFLSENQNKKLNHGFGTYILNNTTTTTLEDKNYSAIKHALQLYNEPFYEIEPSTIPNYSPQEKSRALRALFIPNEGWINPIDLINSLENYLHTNRNISFIYSKAIKINFDGKKIVSVEDSNNNKIFGAQFLIANGTGFRELITNSSLSIKFPNIYFGVGVSLLLKTDENTLSNCIRTPNRGLACGTYAAPQDSNSTLIGASNLIHYEGESFPRLTSVQTLIEGAMSQINTVFYRSQLIRINTGWRPTSADTLPLIGKTQIENLTVVNGMKRDGLHCSPYIASMVSSSILQNNSIFEKYPYHPNRELIKIFSEDEAINLLVEHEENGIFQHGYTPSHDRNHERFTNAIRQSAVDLHSKISGFGIPPELKDIYKYSYPLYI